MGRVIRGSAQSEERYTVAIPSFTSFSPRHPGAEAPASFEPPAPELPPDVPPVPAVDLDALHAEAQALIDDAAQRAETLIANAQLHVDGIIADATSRALLLAADARRTGHDEGHASGVEAAQADMADMLRTLRELIDATRAERHVLLASAEPELVRLAVGIAERVLHQQIALDHGVVVEMARAAIARIVDREKITVRVNPADIERMREHRDELLALGDVKTMRIIEDQRVDRGGVILETDAGSIDAKISTQLTEVRKILHIVDDVVVGPAARSEDDVQTSLAAGAA